jgi:hypothetical protein
LTVRVGVRSLPFVRSVSLRLMLAALVAGAAGVAGSFAGVAAAGPCPDALAGEAGLVPASSDTGERSPCVQLRRSTCRELAQLTSAPIVACAAAPALPAPVSPHIDIAAAPRPRAPIAVAVLTFAPKTSPPQG